MVCRMGVQAPGFLPTLVQRGVLKLLDLMKVPAATGWPASVAPFVRSNLCCAVRGRGSGNVIIELKSYAAITILSAHPWQKPYCSQMQAREQETVSDLLVRLPSMGAYSADDLRAGFGKVTEQLDDLMCDCLPSLS